MDKKYGVRVTPEINNTFKAELLRHRTSRGTVVEKTKTGFESSEAAFAWANPALEEWVTKRKENRRLANQRKRAARKIREEKEDKLEKLSYKQLAELSQTKSNPDCNLANEIFKDKADLLWQEHVFTRVAKEGWEENKAIAEGNTRIGKNYTQRLAKALAGDLDKEEWSQKEKQQQRLATLVAYPRKSMHEGSDLAKSFLTCLQTMPGDKIITITGNLGSHQVFDISDFGKVGYEPEHKNHLFYLLDEAFEQGAGIIIRQFLNKYETEIIKGKPVQIPWKCLYGIFIYPPDMIFASSEQTEECCNMDINGNPLKPEKYVEYGDASDFFRDLI